MVNSLVTFSLFYIYIETNDRPDGSIYKGNWRDGRQHGKAEILKPDGDVQASNWINGSKLG